MGSSSKKASPLKKSESRDSPPPIEIDNGSLAGSQFTTTPPNVVPEDISVAGSMGTSGATAAAVPTTTVLITCKHLPAMAEFLKMYHHVGRALRWSGPSTTSPSPTCAVCRGGDSPILICLQCGHVACWGEENNHWQAHNGETGHALAVEAVTGTVYCAVCKCWVWTDAMERVWKSSKESPKDAASCFAIRAVEMLAGEYGDCLKVCPSVRGLYNLGNTCYMNSVLQVLLHTNPLLDFFLAPVRSHLCKREECIACEMDSLYCRLNDGKTIPLAPHQMLLALWKSSPDMAGYEQHDAHELLVTLRNALHHDLKGTAFNCHCIVHQLFAGVLQSDLTCGSCGHVAETLDPFLDVSLDLPFAPGSMGAIPLDACLQRFTRPERLPAGSFVCEGCQRSGAEIEKRLRIRKCPRVLAIHLKRFDGAAKIDTPVFFPPKLALAAYTVTMDKRDGALDVPQSFVNSYDLFAVISHVGSLDSGHYTAYVRCRDEWFGIDDACVTACGDKEVYNCNAYMVFYSEAGETNS